MQIQPCIRYNATWRVSLQLLGHSLHTDYDYGLLQVPGKNRVIKGEVTGQQEMRTPRRYLNTPFPFWYVQGSSAFALLLFLYFSCDLWDWSLFVIFTCSVIGLPLKNNIDLSLRAHWIVYFSCMMNFKRKCVFGFIVLYIDTDTRNLKYVWC